LLWFLHSLFPSPLLRRLLHQSRSLPRRLLLRTILKYATQLLRFAALANT
jgi:hypothetical protein